HTLEVYRLQPQPEYVGILRVLDVAGERAVGRMIRPQKGRQVKVGDRVASSVRPAKQEPRGDDPLEAHPQRPGIEQEKMMQEIDKRIAEARRAYPDIPDESLRLLRGGLLQVWDHPDLTAQVRDRLLNQLIAARRELTKAE